MMNLAKTAIPLTTIALGLALNLVGILAYLLSQPDASVTALIPSFVGGVFLLLGIFSMKASLRALMIHIALTLALLLAIGTGYQAVTELLKDDAEGSVRKMFAFQTTCMLCVIYVVVGVRSFLHARKMRREASRATRAADAAAVTG